MLRSIKTYESEELSCTTQDEDEELIVAVGDVNARDERLQDSDDGSGMEIAQIHEVNALPRLRTDHPSLDDYTPYLTPESTLTRRAVVLATTIRSSGFTGRKRHKISSL